MARLTRDAIILVARMNAFDTFTITEIALKVFNGADPLGQPSTASLARAARAAASAVAGNMAKAIKEKNKLVAIKSIDNTGGSLHAQCLMNLVISRGIDRRAEQVPIPPEQERRVEDRRHPPVVEPTPAPRPRIIRGVRKIEQKP